VGDLGMSVGEFERITLGEFYCRYAGWLRMVEREKDNLRHAMWATLKPHIKKGRNFTPQHIMKLRIDYKPWERVDTDEYNWLKNGEKND